MADLAAVIFDQDGVLADTERDGHRVAFNQAFAEFGFEVDWDPATYGSLLAIGGGKERMRHYLCERGLDADVDDLDDVVARMHRRKTDVFMELIEAGRIGLRPGVARLVQQAREAGLKLAVCSTSNERAVNTLVRVLLGGHGGHPFDVILAGDMVSRKKPAPDIYLLAVERLGVRPEECVVIEDSANGLAAAVDAGMRCVVTVNDYTRDQDFARADMVVTSLGDPAEPARALAGAEGVGFSGLVTVDVLRAVAARGEG